MALVQRAEAAGFEALVLTWLRGRTRLPLLLEGVLHPDDARIAAVHGVDASIVSDHGGRTLDTALPAAQALPRIADAVQGARAVLVGRPYVHALAVGGAQGVAHVLRLLRDELEIAMALCGCATLADAGPEVLD